MTPGKGSIPKALLITVSVMTGLTRHLQYPKAKIIQSITQPIAFSITLKGETSIMMALDSIMMTLNSIMVALDSIMMTRDAIMAGLISIMMTLISIMKTQDAIMADLTSIMMTFKAIIFSESHQGFQKMALEGHF